MNPLYLADGYKPGHAEMLPSLKGYVYGTWVPRSLKHAPAGITKITQFGSYFAIQYLHDLFKNEFFFTKEREDISKIVSRNTREVAIAVLKNKALKFAEDMSMYLGSPFNKAHLEELWDFGYLPIKVQSLPEGVETNPNIPHLTFINTHSNFPWLTLYLETTFSMLLWKASTAATIARKYRANVDEWLDKTDKDSVLRDFLCHDFSSRGLDPFSNIACGLGFALFFKGSDNLSVIEASRKYYKFSETEVPIYSVRASEHSVTCINIFVNEKKLTEGLLDSVITEFYSFPIEDEGDINNPDFRLIAEYLTIKTWLEKFPTGVLSIVADTFDLWKLITKILPRLKTQILAREGKVVIRPDSGNPVDITCGLEEISEENAEHPESKGVVELLWDIFGGIENEQGYKVLDPHIGAIYGDSITLERQVEIYKRLESKKFAISNVVLGVGSFTMQYNTRDTFGYAAKGAAYVDRSQNTFEIYKEPITDDGTKKSLRGFQQVRLDHNTNEIRTYSVREDQAYSSENMLKTIYHNGNIIDIPSFEEIRSSVLS